MIKMICKIAILLSSVLLVLTSIIDIDISLLTGVVAIILFVSCLPDLSSSYRKPVYVFLVLSILLIIKYDLPFSTITNGASSMLVFPAIAAVLQLFSIPIKVGKYDMALEKYLQKSFKRETSLYISLNIITHIMGSFMLFGTIPILYTIFQNPLSKMVHNHKRFLVTTLSRSFSLVTLWAPGTINVILVLQVTGAKWLQILPFTVMLALIGLITSALLEHRLHLKNRVIKVAEDKLILNNLKDKENNRKLYVLLFIAILLLISIVVMESMQLFTATTRVIIGGFIIVSIWTNLYRKDEALYPAWQEYWGKSIFVSRDLAALFISMGIFAEAIQQAGLLSYIQTYVLSGINLLGQYSFVLIPLLIILLSLVGIHSFISTLLVGNILVSVAFMPHQEVFIALSLLLGGVISFVLSPFAGNVLILARMSESHPNEVGYKWNGLYALSFLFLGLAFLLILQAVWQ